MNLASILRGALASVRRLSEPGPVRTVTIVQDTPDVTRLMAPIVAFARGDEGRRAEAVALHRELLATRPDLRNHPAQVFMAEVDTPMPDLGLRAQSRKAVAA